MLNIYRLLNFILKHPLNKENKIEAVKRFLIWQMSSRLMNCPIALPYINGTSLVAERGMSGATGNWYCGLHEEEYMGFALHILRREELFVDIGANIGSYTILAAGAIGAYCFSVEPIPETVEKLKRNIRFNDLSRLVEVWAGGVSDEESLLKFSIDLGPMNHVLADEEVHGSFIEIPVAPLDYLLKERSPTLMKIDVEGHELRVLNGASGTLSNDKLIAIIIETNGSGARYGVADKQIYDAVSRHGFYPISYDPVKREIRSYDKSNSNTIFIRDIRLVEDRVRNADIFSLVNRTI